MPRIAYQNLNFRDKTWGLIEKANVIIEEYSKQGYRLSLRQLYYQFVSRDFLANSDKNYEMLGKAVSKGRLAGAIDWDAIADRLRPLQALPHWDNPADVIAAAARSYGISLWDGQPMRVEVWVEKDALADIVEKACNAFDVPFLVCRGYASQTSVWEAGRRIVSKRKAGQDTVILHLGDHDPSGMDMTRDNDARLDMLATPTKDDILTHHTNKHKALLVQRVRVKRIALNMDQVRKHKPPPNPAKMSDTRAVGYVERFGRQSWELDALDPKALVSIIQSNIKPYIKDKQLWQTNTERQATERALLAKVSERWPKIIRNSKRWK